MSIVADLVSDEPRSCPVVVLALVEGLSDTTLFAAALQGGSKYRGWGAQRHLAADLWDLTAAIAYGAAGSKKRPPSYPRPTAKAKQQRTILDMFRSTGGNDVR